MIQCNIQACAEICQPALEKTNKDGKKFLTFTVKIPIKGKDNSFSDLFLSVSTNGDYSKIGNYPVGRRVILKGKMIPRKYKGLIYYNVHTEGDVLTAAPGNALFLSGTLDFKGKTGKKVQQLSDKKNRPYQAFSAFSTNKTGDDAEFIWVHFMNFHLTEANKVSEEQSVAITGDLHFNAYRKDINMDCIVKSIGPWVWNKSTENESK